MYDPTRRDALRLLVAASAGCATGAASAAAAAAGAAAGQGATPPRFAADFVPKLPMDVYAKIRCSLRDEAVPFWYRGHVMIALQDDIPRPILGVEGFSHTRFTPDTNDGWMTQLVEVGYFTDPATGAIVDDAKNPLNGASIRPRHFRAPVQALRVRPNGAIWSSRRITPPSEFLGRVWTPHTQGPETWVDEDAVAKLSSDALPAGLHEGGPVRMLTLGAMTTYRARTADVADPRLASAPCTFHLQELASLPVWFGMGDAVGKQLWRVSGRKLGSVDEIPPALRARIERDHPGFVSAPGL
jgi:Protein of unknown function (DUF1838)